MLLKWIQVWIIFVFSVQLNAQTPSYNFNHLNTGNGLSDPAVRNFAQDRYGYIWMGTLNGLNRFNGYEITIFRHKLNDSLSLPENYVRGLVSDREGRIWIGSSTGICQYDNRTGHFNKAPSVRDISVYKMERGVGSELFLATAKGLGLFNTSSGTFYYLHTATTGGAKTLMSKAVNDFCISKTDIYLATDTGLIIYNKRTKEARIIAVKGLAGLPIQQVALDSAGNFWYSFGKNGELICKVNRLFTHSSVYKLLDKNGKEFTDNHVSSIYCDSSGRVWVTSSRTGVIRYNEKEDKLIQFMNDPYLDKSLSSNLTTCIFQAKQGFLWVGTENSGADYFNPETTFFKVIQPAYNQTPTLPDFWGRASGEDKNGNLWLGTANGIAVYNPMQKTFRVFRNEDNGKQVIQTNSIRSLLCDGDFIWIGTAQGLNRYHLSTGKMDTFSGKDSIAGSFFWSIEKDGENNVWFGTRDGIFLYNSVTNHFSNVLNNPVLAPYRSFNTYCVFKDSRDKLWFGFTGKGLLQYDSRTKVVKYWQSNEGSSGALTNDQVTSIAEDKTGVIWVATIDGLNSIDPVTGKLTQYLKNRGQSSEKTSSLLIDDKNRLWFAGEKGITMLDASRRHFKTFSTYDDLPTLDFNNQSAFRTSNGNFIFPSLRGFVVFNPGEFNLKRNARDLYISGFSVSGDTEFQLTNFEETGNISLSANQNFFSMELTSLNYDKPGASWYAYKLEPFDKGWIFTKDRKLNYTNVPGGNYIFHYKASTDTNDWNVAEKSINIHVATIYYRAWWFFLLVLTSIIFTAWKLYRWRMNQKEKVILLQTKAHSLEREKAKVMYESLKQQLNPHFLFNSLTSLSSLISSNPVNAKKFLERMSKIYRYILKSRDNETVLLSEELSLVEVYIQLQKTRFKEGLQLEVDLGEDCFDRRIAPVTLQNLIENAIKHNVIDEATPLIIKIVAQDGWLVIKNNLQRKGFVETSNRQGLESMQALYYYLSGKKIDISEDGENFTVKIPML